MVRYGKIIIDQSSANTAVIKAIYKLLKGFGCPILIEMVRQKTPQQGRRIALSVHETSELASASI